MVNDSSPRYTLFHMSWKTFNFNRKQLGTVSAYVISACHNSYQREMNVCMELLAKITQFYRIKGFGRAGRPLPHQQLLKKAIKPNKLLRIL